MLEIKRREGESISSFLHRFNQKIRQSGILREAKKRRFHGRRVTKAKRKKMALYRIKKTKSLGK